MDGSVLTYKSPAGNILCLFDGQFLTEVSIKRNPLSRMHDKMDSSSPAAADFFQELDAYFKGDLKKFRQKIKFVRGTAFEQNVWLALKGIPYGEMRSYKWLAERIGKPKALRAVGQALKKNPLPIILPCHRIVASDGSLGGFSCGVDIKEWLLRHEGAI
jgi:methylated-DNA-[protein]-cysteine S-methyltransferase